MTIRAVVLDVGGVLEVIDDPVFPGPWEERLGLGPGGFHRSVDGIGDPGLGQVSEVELREHWRARLGLDAAAADELMRDFWRWYVGTLDERLYRWFAGLRPALLAGILSNSCSGAREAERCWGFEAITDDIVYSHEVGLAKPDPAVYALTTERLGVAPAEIVFLDDLAANVDAAREFGWHAVLHEETARSIAEVGAVLAAQR